MSVCKCHFRIMFSSHAHDGHEKRLRGRRIVTSGNNNAQKFSIVNILLSTQNVGKL